MRPGLRPRLLSSLRDMLAEKEEDLAALQVRLRASEQFNHSALVRLERLEAKFGLQALQGHGHSGHGVADKDILGKRLQRLETVTEEVRQGAACGSGGVAIENGNDSSFLLRAALAPDDEAGGASSSQRLVEQLRQQLSLTMSRQVAAEREASELQSRLSQTETKAEAQEQAVLQALMAYRQLEAQLRQQIAQGISETEGLRAQLVRKEEDVLRLEGRVVELQGLLQRAAVAPNPGADGRSSPSPGVLGSREALSSEEAVAPLRTELSVATVLQLPQQPELDIGATNLVASTASAASTGSCQTVNAVQLAAMSTSHRPPAAAGGPAAAASPARPQAGPRQLSPGPRQEVLLPVPLSASGLAMPPRQASSSPSRSPQPYLEGPLLHALGRPIATQQTRSPSPRARAHLGGGVLTREIASPHFATTTTACFTGAQAGQLSPTRQQQILRDGFVFPTTPPVAAVAPGAAARSVSPGLSQRGTPVLSQRASGLTRAASTPGLPQGISTVSPLPAAGRMLPLSPATAAKMYVEPRPGAVTSSRQRDAVGQKADPGVVSMQLSPKSPTHFHAAAAFMQDIATGVAAAAEPPRAAQNSSSKQQQLQQQQQLQTARAIELHRFPTMLGEPVANPPQQDAARAADGLSTSGGFARSGSLPTLQRPVQPSTALPLPPPQAGSSGVSLARWAGTAAS
eukprot:TRINITY_DN6296_c1_g1_i4.p1 TRINITY_DN6296_c1_g1~~TRINITY_DN6296_c1_g1_i4.p1  ORF type:complete len:686 (-),score=169.31 TRINITY_DN6296_c1_g1_i4:122-2179(-)